MAGRVIEITKLLLSITQQKHIAYKGYLLTRKKERSILQSNVKSTALFCLAGIDRDAALLRFWDHDIFKISEENGGLSYGNTLF